MRLYGTVCTEQNAAKISIHVKPAINHISNYVKNTSTPNYTGIQLGVGWGAVCRIDAEMETIRVINMVIGV